MFSSLRPRVLRVLIPLFFLFVWLSMQLWCCDDRAAHGYRKLSLYNHMLAHPLLISVYALVHRCGNSIEGD
ncbi:hypothetical protein V8B97DRAFT_1977772 [Scleroderma yunnanense]